MTFWLFLAFFGHFSSILAFFGHLKLLVGTMKMIIFGHIWFLHHFWIIFQLFVYYYSYRLVVWRYAKSSANKPFSANCRELTLPPSDLAHNAKLVNVFATNQNQTPSCIAVSPEGKFIFQCCHNIVWKFDNFSSHSDFTWNQFWRIYKFLKFHFCHF